MSKPLLKDALGLRLVLWLIGYPLGIVLFYVLPPRVIGWVILPIGVFITLWVLLIRVKANTFGHSVVLAVVWTALVFDYLFIARAFQPTDGYYKLDVYLYYALTFLMPFGVGWQKMRRLHETVA